MKTLHTKQDSEIRPAQESRGHATRPDGEGQALRTLDDIELALVGGGDGTPCWE